MDTVKDHPVAQAGARLPDDIFRAFAEKRVFALQSQELTHQPRPDDSESSEVGAVATSEVDQGEIAELLAQMRAAVRGEAGGGEAG